MTAVSLSLADLAALSRSSLTLWIVCALSMAASSSCFDSFVSSATFSEMMSSTLTPRSTSTITTLVAMDHRGGK